MAGIPLVDLKAQYATIKTEIDAAMARVLADTSFIGGKEVERFEQAFAAYCGTPGCVGVGNGTDAIYIALRAAGIGAGDEVITVANTFIATTEAIGQTGATPVMVDALDDTLLIDPAAIEAAITPRTRAILVVHLYGQPCDMDRIMAIAGRHKLLVVEDSAQAHGARWNGKRVGTFGDFATFSFYPGKNLGAYGDGGAIVGRDPALLARARMIANHGRKEKYTHEMEGVNSRLDGLQAAILGVKLARLDDWNAARRRLAARYRERLAGLPLRCVTEHAKAEGVYHLMVVRLAERDRIEAAMKAAGIGVGVHYPLPLHRQPAYAHLGMPEGSLPVSEAAAREILSLPLFPELADADLDRVADVLAAQFRSSAEAAD